MGLSLDNIKFLANHVSSVTRHPTLKDRLVVQSDGGQLEKIGNIIKTAYSANRWKNVSWTKLPGIVVIFDTWTQRETAFKDLNAKISNYIQSHMDDFPALQYHVATYVVPQTDNGTESDLAPVKEDDEETETDWTTYIIIGLAVVALVLLVWPKSKK